MKRVSVEVIAPTLTSMYHCSYCELMFDEVGIGEQVHEGAEGYPAHVQEDYRRLMEWLADLGQTYEDHVSVRLIDPQSLLGMYKSLRHRVREYPTFVIDGEDKAVGWDRAAVDGLLAHRFKASGAM